MRVSRECITWTKVSIFSVCSDKCSPSHIVCVCLSWSAGLTQIGEESLCQIEHCWVAWKYQAVLGKNVDFKFWKNKKMFRSIKGRSSHPLYGAQRNWRLCMKEQKLVFALRNRQIWVFFFHLFVCNESHLCGLCGNVEECKINIRNWNKTEIYYRTDGVFKNMVIVKWRECFCKVSQMLNQFKVLMQRYS